MVFFFHCAGGLGELQSHNVSTIWDPQVISASLFFQTDSFSVRSDAFLSQSFQIAPETYLSEGRHVLSFCQILTCGPVWMVWTSQDQSNDGPVWLSLAHEPTTDTLMMLLSSLQSWINHLLQCCSHLGALLQSGHQVDSCFQLLPCS